MFDTLDKIEGKPTQRELRKQKVEQQAVAEAKKKHEIEELQNQIQQLKNLQQQVSGKPIPNETKAQKRQPDEVEPSLGGVEIENEEEDEDENVCIFCGERDGTKSWKFCFMAFKKVQTFLLKTVCICNVMPLLID